MTRSLSRTAVGAAALLVAACGTGAPAPVGVGDVDPAVTSALQDPILTDPALSQQANATTIRPPDLPVQALYPPDFEPEPAPDEPCGSGFSRGSEWGSAPAELPAYPGARLVDAAGIEEEGCRMRFAAFESGDSAERLLAHYRAAAERAGWTAEQGARGGSQVLHGGGGEDHFYLIVSPAEEGSEAALIVARGG